MKKKYGLLVLIIVISITLIVCFNNKSNNKLDEVKLTEKDSEMFAIMIEQDDLSYQKSDSNEWPDSTYIFNIDKSGCIDKNGNKIKEEILTFDEDTRKATVETSKTSYCYLYFDKKPITIQELLNSNPENLNKTIQGGMYRYQGTSNVVDNNYICFGTSNKNECTSNLDIYMYRIIGIVGDETDSTVSNNMVKVIKMTELKEDAVNTFQWHTGYSGDEYADILWSNSSLKQRLNGESNGNNQGSIGNTNIFLNTDNSLYLYMKDTKWTDKIVNKNWYEGDIGLSHVPNTASLLFETEHGITEAKFYRGSNVLQTTKWTLSNDKFKIGLMPLSDYYWSYSSAGVDCHSDNYAVCKDSWIHFINNDVEISEWTMTRLGRYNYNDDRYTTWYIDSTGLTYSSELSGLHTVRPVFYLSSDILLSRSTGTLSDPLIIKN